MFPPITEREMALPWYHERFKLRDDPELFQTGKTGREGDKRTWYPEDDDDDDTGVEEQGNEQPAAAEGAGESGVRGRKGKAGRGKQRDATGVEQEEDEDAVELEGPLARALAVSTKACQ